MNTPILNDEDLVQYVRKRYAGSNISLDQINSVWLHNGKTEDLLQRSLGNEQIQIQQDNAREPFFFNEGIAHVPQWSGFKRRVRYESTLERYRAIVGPGFEIRSLEIDGKTVKEQGNRRKTNQLYSDYAYDFVKQMIHPEIDGIYVFPDRDIKNIHKIIFGPVKAFQKLGIDVVARGTSSYLDAQILRVGKEEVLNLGYVYGDQIGILIDKFMREFESVQAEQGKNKTFHTYLFGRGASLIPGIERHDLVYPAGIIDENDLERRLVHPFVNSLADHKPFTGIDLNVSNVANESVEMIEAARDLGCVSVDQEIIDLFLSAKRAEVDYNGLIRIKAGVVLHVSDRPLIIEGGRRDTLAIELDSDLGEQRAALEIAQAIEKSQS